VDFLIGWPGGDWQASARLAGTLAVGYLGLIWLASVLWVYRDITSRSRDPISQTIAVAIAGVLPLVGLPIYFALRPSETLQDAYDRQIEQEAILSEMHSVSSCPNCRRPVEAEFMVCAYCGSGLKSPCSSCGQLLRHAWRFCPHCATPRVPVRGTRAVDLGAGDEGYDDDLDEALEGREQPRRTFRSPLGETQSVPAAPRGDARPPQPAAQPPRPQPARSEVARAQPARPPAARALPPAADD
jgi:hypothetical protein